MKKNEKHTLHIPRESEAKYLEGILKKIKGRILFPEKVERAKNMLKDFENAEQLIRR